MPDPTLMTALGAVVALSLSTMGAAVASATSAAYAMSSREGVKSFVPIIISGVLGIYGLIVAVILSNQMHGGTTDLTSADGYRNFTAGLAVGFTMPGEQLGHLFVYDVSPDKKFGCLERQPLHHEVCRRRKKSRRQHTHSMMTCTLHHFREISFFLLLLQTRWGAWYPRLKIQKRF